MISFPEGFDIAILVADVVSFAAPFIPILGIFLAYKLIMKVIGK